MSERDKVVGGIAEQDLKTGEGVEVRVPVGRVGVKHESRPHLPGQAVYLFREVWSLLQGCYFERHLGLVLSVLPQASFAGPDDGLGSICHLLPFVAPSISSVA